MYLSLDFTTFRVRFQSLVDSRGFNLHRLSDELGIDASSLARYLNGKRTPDLAYIVRISDYFDVSIDWLLGLDQNIRKSFPEEVAEFATLYSTASEADRKIIQTILNKYKRG